MTRILAVDLDGTLLASDGTISRANRDALDRARDAGMHVVLATGRSYSESREAIQATGHQGWVVAAGGSMLCDAQTGETVERRLLDLETVELTVEILLEFGHRALLLKDEHATGYDYLLVGHADLDVATEWWFKTQKIEVRSTHSMDDDPHPHQTVRAGVVAHGDAMPPLAEEVQRQVGDRAYVQHWPAVTQTEASGGAKHLLEVFGCDVNKWTMLLSCCRRLGVDPAQTIAIGDGLNDVDIVANAGLGIAMDNGLDSVKDAAQHVTAHHDQDGVAQAIDRILSGEWVA